MAKHFKRAAMCLYVFLIVQAIALRSAWAETVILAAADTQPTAYLVDGKPTGILVDLVTEAYRRAGHSVEIRLMPWTRCIQEAKIGKVDGIFSSFKFQEREGFLNFSKEVLIVQVISLFVRSDSPLHFDGNLATFRQVSIGTVNGTSYGEAFDEAVKNGTLKNVVYTNSIESNLKMLVLGRVDLIPSYRYVVLDSARRMKLLVKIRELSPPLQSVPSYLAFTKVRDLTKLSDDFDIALAAMKQDGTYDRIVERYTASGE